MEVLRENFERAWKSVIAPTKYSYNINSIFPKQVTINSQILQRIDLDTINDQGKNISAVILTPKKTSVKQAILYFHGNGGTKIQIFGIATELARHNIALISFDYLGCGNSDTGYLTYGANEASDAQIVLRQAYKHIDVEKLTVWGRSMGAVTAINFSARNPKIVNKMILDSPFRYLEGVIKRVIRHQTGLPHLFINIFTYFLTKQIEERVKFPLFCDDYLQNFKKISKSLPIMFICSDNDIVVPRREVEEFYQLFRGHKQLLQIDQSHQQDRGASVYEQVVGWIRRKSTRKNTKLRLYRPIEYLKLQDEQITSYC